MTADLLGPDPAAEWQDWTNSMFRADARERVAEERLAAARADLDLVEGEIRAGHLPVTSGLAAREIWLKPREARDRLGVTVETLRRWADNGDIEHRRNHSNHREYALSAVNALLDLMSAEAAS